MPDRRRFPRFTCVEPADARVRVLIGGCLASVHGDAAVIMTEDAVPRDDEVVLQVNEPSGERLAWSARVRDCQPVSDRGVQRFRLHVSLLGPAEAWPEVEKGAE